MKRETTYQIVLILVDDEDSYADPYAKRRYSRETIKYGDKSEAEKAFRLFKKSKRYSSLEVVRANLERVTVTSMKE